VVRLTNEDNIPKYDRSMTYLMIKFSKLMFSSRLQMPVGGVVAQEPRSPTHATSGSTSIPDIGGVPEVLRNEQLETRRLRALMMDRPFLKAFCVQILSSSMLFAYVSRLL
jgi:hypothetical protein